PHHHPPHAPSPPRCPDHRRPASDEPGTDDRRPRRDPQRPPAAQSDTRPRAATPRHPPPRYHSTRHARRRDNRRDREVTALGWRPVRFTYEEIAFEAGDVGDEVGELLQDQHAC